MDFIISTVYTLTFYILTSNNLYSNFILLSMYIYQSVKTFYNKEKVKSETMLVIEATLSVSNTPPTVLSKDNNLKRNHAHGNQTKSKRRHKTRKTPRVNKPKAAPVQLSIDTEMPGLSDGESSVSSPCLSTISLPKEQPCYSLFSTGFDFGVSPSIEFKEQKFHHYQQYFQQTVPSVENLALVQQKRRSLLDMLDQDQQAQTTITPTAFSYFDDMMMSTSLYKHNHSPVHEWDHRGLTR